MLLLFSDSPHYLKYSISCLPHPIELLICVRVYVVLVHMHPQEYTGLVP